MRRTSFLREIPLGLGGKTEYQETGDIEGRKVSLGEHGTVRGE
jgi:hypothetical protein